MYVCLYLNRTSLYAAAKQPSKEIGKRTELANMRRNLHRTNDSLQLSMIECTNLHDFFSSEQNLQKAKIRNHKKKTKNDEANNKKNSHHRRQITMQRSKLLKALPRHVVVISIKFFFIGFWLFVGACMVVCVCACILSANITNC